jgi:HK97 gp10 family phage protein
MGTTVELDGSGFDELETLLQQYENSMSAEGVTNILEAGAKEFVKDLLKLPKPISKIHAPGYTHLVKTFAYKTYAKTQEIEVGWGKYYGPMVEKGTRKMKANAHLIPLYNTNKKKYEQLMVNEFFKN